MTDRIISQKKLDLIKKLAEERKASSAVTAAEGGRGIIKAYNIGKTIKGLEKLHEGYSASHGRIFPFYDEDYDTVNPEVQADGEDGAIGEIVYHWAFVSDLGNGFSNFAFHLSEMEDKISDLTSWHPDFNSETGEIDG
jgi:hypothetical protein